MKQVINQKRSFKESHYGNIREDITILGNCIDDLFTYIEEQHNDDMSHSPLAKQIAEIRKALSNDLSVMASKLDQIDGSRYQIAESVKQLDNDLDYTIDLLGKD